MSTDQEKSFTATLRTRFGSPHFPKLTYGKTIRTKKPDYDFFGFDQYMDVSDYLFLKPEIAPDALTFYFRCLDDYYTLYIFTQGVYYYMTLSKENDDFLNAYTPNDGDHTTFNLLDANGKIITLDQLDNNTPTVRIQTRGGSLLRAGLSNSPYDSKVGTFVRTSKNRSSSVLDFKLNILQRNVPY